MACIYCGADNADSEEHVIPYCLGGTQVLEDASCGRCRDLTSLFELHVCRYTYSWMRKVTGYPSRKPKNMPTTVPVVFVEASGEERRRDLPIEQVPFPVLVPQFPLPAEAAEIPGWLSSPGLVVVPSPALEAATSALFRAHGNGAPHLRMMSQGVKIESFAQLLYKIALGALFLEGVASRFDLSELRRRILDRSCVTFETMEDIRSAPSRADGPPRAALSTHGPSEYVEIRGLLRPRCAWDFWVRLTVAD